MEKVGSRRQNHRLKTERKLQLIINIDNYCLHKVTYYLSIGTIGAKMSDL